MRSTGSSIVSRGGFCIVRNCAIRRSPSQRISVKGFGRGKGRDRARPLEIARGEAEEAIRHLSANFRANRIDAREHWPIHNLFVVIVKMLNSLLNR